MDTRKNQADPPHQDRMADCLRAQARLCERIASECWNEDIATKFKVLAGDCIEAADKAQPRIVRAACRMDLSL